MKIHYTRTVGDNPDMKDHGGFWKNARYTMAGCELGIEKVIRTGKNKAGGNAKPKGNVWYQRRLRAIDTATKHARGGVDSREWYTNRATERAKKKKNTKRNIIYSTGRRTT